MASPPGSQRRTLGGAVLLAIGLFILARMAGPIRLSAIVFLAAGAFYLNRTDPKRLGAILLVLAAGFGYLAYRGWNG